MVGAGGVGTRRGIDGDDGVTIAEGDEGLSGDVWLWRVMSGRMAPVGRRQIG